MSSRAAGIAEAGHRTGPVGVQKVGLALLATDPLAVGAKPGTALARHNLVADEGQGSHKCTGTARLACGERRKSENAAFGESRPLVFRCAGDVVRIRDWPRGRLSFTASPRSLEFQ